MQSGFNAVYNLDESSSTPPRQGYISLSVVTRTLASLAVVLGESSLSPSEQIHSEHPPVAIVAEEPAVELMGITAGTSILQKDILADLSSDSMMRPQVRFRIERDAHSKSVSMTVDGKSYTSKDTIWWLGFARATDVLSDIQASGDGGLILTADNIGYVVVSAEEVKKVLYQLSLAPKDVTEITLPINAYPTTGSVAEKMLGNKPNKINCTIHAEYTGLNVQQLAKK